MLSLPCIPVCVMVTSLKVMEHRIEVSYQLIVELNSFQYMCFITIIYSSIIIIIIIPVIIVTLLQYTDHEMHRNITDKPHHLSLKGLLFILMRQHKCVVAPILIPYQIPASKILKRLQEKDHWQLCLMMNQTILINSFNNIYDYITCSICN